ncbi:hypothetical protein PIB30_030455 [Stylosanthes scabra]|uniref:Uncharacterized protein n=1 Tax=Stylosanthes scabra TaxID=79078 RepID=A0ABU6TBB9_9FABA|nr:hypothetical protein [Stylosanthes scabra]
MINEWISLEIDDQRFEVHVIRKVGAEAYSVESHPNHKTEDYVVVSLEFIGDASKSMDALSGNQQSLESLHHVSWNGVSGDYGDDTNVIINGGICIDGVFNSEAELSSAVKGPKYVCWYDMVTEWYLEAAYGLTSLDPMILEAECAIKDADNRRITRPRTESDGLGEADDTQSSNSCPYPPGFGPCDETIKGQTSPEFVSETPRGVGDLGWHTDIELVVPPPHEEHRLSKERQRDPIPKVADVRFEKEIEAGAFPNAKHVLWIDRDELETLVMKSVEVVGDEGLKDAIGTQSLAGEDAGSVSVETDSIEVESGETLYLINKEVDVGDWNDLDIDMAAQEQGAAATNSEFKIGDHNCHSVPTDDDLILKSLGRTKK